MIGAYYALLGAWLVVLLSYPVFQRVESWQLGLGLGTLTVLALVGVLAARLVNRARIVAGGYLLATVLFVAFAASALTTPVTLFLLSAGLLLPIIVAGAVVGGNSPYLFAFGSVLINSVAWLIARHRSDVLPFFPTDIAMIAFLFGHAVASLVTAAVLNVLSNQVQRTIENLNRQAERMIELAHTDPLTSLSNRRHMIDQLEREFARARRYRRPLCFLYIDFDDFKAINDRFGHLFGDDILRNAARAMQAVLRSTDLLARIGGDEFAVLLPETTLEGGINVAIKLRKAVASYSRQLGPSIPTLSFCTGVSRLGPDDQAVDDILARADQAQYLAKATGKGQTRTERDLGMVPQTSKVDDRPGDKP